MTIPTLYSIRALSAALARHDLAELGTWLQPEHAPAAHHRLLIEALQQIENRSVERLFVFMPPGHAKSTWSSVLFPLFLFGRDPTITLIHCCHTQELAERFGRRIRNNLASPQYQAVFGLTLSNSSRAAGRWDTLQGGEYFAAGVGGAITGRRADIAIIDDPVRSREEADSPTQRETTWQWYLADLRTRLKPGGRIVVVMTRWHEDDLAGRILPQNFNGRTGVWTARDGETWNVICLQALADIQPDPLGRAPGEALWPAWMSRERLLQEKASQGARNWAALYQQLPRPSEGGMFQEQWLQRFSEAPLPPARRMVVQSWDTAHKPGELNDPSVCLTWALAPHGHYLLDVFRERLKYPQLRRAAQSLAQRWQPDAILIEDKASGQSLIQDLQAQTSLPVIAIQPVGDKITRASAVSPQFEAGRVHLPEQAPWLVEYEAELFGFPVATHDDQVDATSQYLSWARTHAGKITIRTAGAASAASTADGFAGIQAGPTPTDASPKGWGSIRGGVDHSGY